MSLLHKVKGLVAHTYAPGTPEAVAAHDEHVAATSPAESTPSQQYTTYSDHPSPSASPPVPPPTSSTPLSSSASPDVVDSTLVSVDSNSSAPLPPVEALDVPESTRLGDHSSGGETAPTGGLQGSAIEDELAKMEARTTTISS